jgi:hypothetical protein
MVDTLALGASAFGCEGSSPSLGTKYKFQNSTCNKNFKISLKSPFPASLGVLLESKLQLKSIYVIFISDDTSSNSCIIRRP